MRGDLGLAGLTGRQLRDDLGPAAVLALLVLMVSAIFAAAPAAMSSIATAEIRDAVTALSPTDRDLTEKTTSALPQGPAPAGTVTDLPAAEQPVWGSFAGALAHTHAAFPEPARQATDPARFYLSTAAAGLADDPAVTTGKTMQVTFNVDPYLSEHLRLVSGKWPAPGDGIHPDGTIDLQVVLAKSSAAEMQWTVGATRSAAVGGAVARLKLVGLTDAAADSADYLVHNPFANQPNIFDDGNQPIRVTGSVFVNSGDWSIAQSAGSAQALIWYPVRAGSVTSANVEAMTAALRRVTVVEYPVVGAPTDQATFALTSLQLTTDLPAALDAARARVVSASAVQTVAALGPCGAALAVLALGLQSFLRRRRPTTALLVSRGASLGQVRRSLAVQGVLIGLPAAVVAVLVVQLLFGWRAPWWAMMLGLLAGLIPAAALPLGVSASGLRAARSDFGTASAGRPGWIGEVVVLALAALSLYLLLSGGLAAGSGGGADVLVAAAPVFLTLAVCVLVLRCYPLVLLAIQRTMRGRRGAVGFLGAARSLREPMVGTPLIVATVTGVAVAVFSVVTLATVTSGIDGVAARTVGADLRAAGPWMTEDVVDRVRAIPGVEVVSTAGFGGSIALKSDSGTRNVNLYFVDSTTFAQVQQDIPGAPAVPTTMGTRTDAGVPIVVSDSVRAALPGTLTVDGDPVDVVGTGRYSAGLGDRGDWAIADVTLARSLLTSNGVPDTVLVSLQPGSGPAAAAALTKIVGPDAVVQRPSDVVDRLTGAPTIGGMRAALIAATALGLLLVALAVLVTAVSGTRTRNRLFAVLRALGLDRRQMAQLAGWEQAPPALTAVVVGGGFGVLLAAVIGGVVDLRAFTGGTDEPALSVQLWSLLTVIGGFVVVVALAIGVSSLLARRAGAATVLRMED
ncbi:ABC transporter permease [Nakamurella lactea]|uniref:ABC transporter permease n=1 Tax=Nakamurella lactea TaxID=459515 RepID=UPI0012B5F319|nr:ABC transporter permease [Nakamurella lactea]